MDSTTASSDVTSGSNIGGTIPETDTPGCISYNIATRFVIAGIIVVLGIVSNIITVVVMRKDRSKSATITMLTHLAIVDGCILVVDGSLTIAYPIASLIGGVSLANNVKLIMLRYVGLSYIGQTLIQISVLFTLIVTWQRYISVCVPHRAKSFTCKKVTNSLAISSTIISFLLYLPGCFQFSIIHDPNGRLQLKETSLGSSWFFSVLYSSVTLFSINYVIPVSLLIFMAAQLIHHLREAKKRTAASSAIKRAQREITLSLVVVVIVFIVFQSFSPLRRILIWLYGPYVYNLQLKCGGQLFYLGPLIKLSPLINSAANFVIYVLFARGFRRKVAHFIGKASTTITPLEMS